MESLREIFFKIDRIHYSMFDLPEADKCLLASGELDVRCLSASGGFDVHQFLFRLEWPFFGPAARLNTDTCLRSRLKRSVSGETYNFLHHVVRKMPIRAELISFESQSNNIYFLTRFTAALRLKNF